MRNLALILAQDYDKILEECRKEKKMWTDDMFKPENNSICPESQWDEEKYGSLKWVRCGKIPSLTDDDGDVEVFYNDPKPDDIK